MIELKTPTLELLPRYVDALQRGWMLDHIIGIAATQDQLSAIEQDAAGFVARQTDLKARGGPVLVESFTKPAAFGNAPGLRFRITL